LNDTTKLGVKRLKLNRRKSFLIILLALSILHLFTISSLAIDDIQDLQAELGKEAVDTSVDNNIAVEFIKLLVILGLILGAAWSIVKLFGKKASVRLQGTWLNVVDEVILGQNRGIVLCEVGQKIYAVGVTNHNISLLFEINNEKLLEEISSGDYMNHKQPLGIKLFQNGIGSLLKGTDSLSNKKDFHFLMEEQNQKLHEVFKHNKSNADEREK